ncbi:FAD/NAD(P)-binding oxidoreductase [Actinidia rufa]|uniref:FAD/NAD(P)-binding oxidoreductase n=1 Tax=Actinidia rufa TaxID=165716 RepID=A0A7J0HEI5_9ERIC|nr:FAD/NAD(P)-binding oxidoreductase [Actinidia rufa]
MFPPPLAASLSRLQPRKESNMHRSEFETCLLLSLSTPLSPSCAATSPSHGLPPPPNPSPSPPPPSAWTAVPLAGVRPAAESLFHITVDVSDSPDLAASHVRWGQYLQLRLPDAEKPSFLAVASPPSLTEEKGVLEFSVKRVAGSTAELLCGLGKGDVVELTQVNGERLRCRSNFAARGIFNRFNLRHWIWN